MDFQQTHVIQNTSNLKSTVDKIADASPDLPVRIIENTNQELAKLLANLRQVDDQTRQKIGTGLRNGNFAIYSSSPLPERPQLSIISVHDNVRFDIKPQGSNGELLISVNNGRPLTEILLNKNEANRLLDLLEKSANQFSKQLGSATDITRDVLGDPNLKDFVKQIAANRSWGFYPTAHGGKELSEVQKGRLEANINKGTFTLKSYSSGAQTALVFTIPADRSAPTGRYDFSNEPNRVFELLLTTGQPPSLKDPTNDVKGGEPLPQPTPEQARALMTILQEQLKLPRAR